MEEAENLEEHKDQNYLTASMGISAFSNGVVIAVWVEKFGKEYAKVTVVTKRRTQTNFATGLTESTFQQRFAQAVDILRSGQSLPDTPPSPVSAQEAE